MTHWLIGLLCTAGFALMLLSLPRQQALWLRQALSAPVARLLRTGGFVALAIAWWVAGQQSGFGYGTVVWFGWISIAAILFSAANARQWSLRKSQR